MTCLVCTPLLWPGDSPMLGWLLGRVCSSPCCCEPCHHLSCSLNLHSSLQCLLNLSHEDLFGFPGFWQSIIQSRNWAFFLWECALDGYLTQIHPAVPLCVVWHWSMVALFLAYSSFSLEWPKQSQWLAVASLLALLLSCPQSGQEEHSGLVLSASGSHWQRQRETV